MNESLRTALKQLRLSGMTQSLEVRLQEAAGNGLNHTEFLELVLQDELLVRKERQIKRRIKAAMFREFRNPRGFRPAVQSINQKETDLRLGELPVHQRVPGLEYKMGGIATEKSREVNACISMGEINGDLTRCPPDVCDL